MVFGFSKSLTKGHREVIFVEIRRGYSEYPTKCYAIHRRRFFDRQIVATDDGYDGKHDAFGYG